MTLRDKIEASHPRAMRNAEQRFQASKVIASVLSRHEGGGTYADVAYALDHADLLVTPAHDAAVAAKALREAAAFVDEYAYEPSDVEKPPSGQERGFYLGATEAHRVVYRLLNERADRIEASHE